MWNFFTHKICSMIEKLIINRYIDMTGLPIPGNVGGNAGGFQQVASTTLHLNESESLQSGFRLPRLYNNATRTDEFVHGVKSKFLEAKSHVVRDTASGVSAGAHAKARRNFTWLPWIPGMVSEVPCIGVDVLTGPLSGCWITRHQRNGVWCVGHVGTMQDAAHNDSVAAKAAWNTFAAGSLIYQREAFNPMKKWVGPMPRNEGDGQDYLMGLVTATGEFYAVLTWRDYKYPSRLRIAAVQRMMNQLPPNGQID